MKAKWKFRLLALLNLSIWLVIALLFQVLMNGFDDPVRRRGYGTMVVYSLLMLVASTILISLVRGTAVQRLKKGYVWLYHWHLRLIITVLAGALLGAVLFSIIGNIAQMPYTQTEMLKNGMFDGGFYALIWAPGISLVLCLIKAKKAWDDRSSEISGTKQ